MYHMRAQSLHALNGSTPWHSIRILKTKWMSFLLHLMVLDLPSNFVYWEFRWMFYPFLPLRLVIRGRVEEGECFAHRSITGVMFEDCGQSGPREISRVKQFTNHQILFGQFNYDNMNQSWLGSIRWLIVKKVHPFIYWVWIDIRRLQHLKAIIRFDEYSSTSCIRIRPKTNYIQTSEFVQNRNSKFRNHILHGEESVLEHLTGWWPSKTIQSLLLD